METEAVRRVLPGSYSEMYPGRFLKADMLKGKKVTVTIKSIYGEDLIGENNKAESEWIVMLVERPLELVLNKTNAFCLYRMFGTPPTWIGKRITIYPTTTKFGRNTVDAIRVWGSPDIPEDMEITVPQGRKKAWETVMHATAVKTEPTVTAPASTQASPRMSEIFQLLNWSPDVQANWLYNNINLTTDAMISKLESELDK